MASTGAVAALLVEPMQGTAGNVIPPNDFLPAVKTVASEHDALLIVDEMLTGFGRTGRYFGLDHSGVTPDIVTMEKGIGNGAPLGACVTRPEIARTLTRRTHFNTFGGNPIAITQGLATLEVIDRENIQENARAVGEHLKRRLLDLQERQPLIGDVRGLGLMLGIRLKSDSRAFVSYLRTRGILTVAAGDNVVRVLPPLNIEEHHIREFIDGLSAAAADYEVPEAA